MQSAQAPSGVGGQHQGTDSGGTPDRLLNMAANFRALFDAVADAAISDLRGRNLKLALTAALRHFACEASPLGWRGLAASAEWLRANIAARTGERAAPIDACAAWLLLAADYLRSHGAQAAAEQLIGFALLERFAVRPSETAVLRLRDELLAIGAADEAITLPAAVDFDRACL